MSDMTILEQWRSVAYNQNADKNKLQRFWATYFNIEKNIYEQLLENPDEVAPREDLSHTVKLCSLYAGLAASARLAEEAGVTLYLEPLNISTDHPGNFLRDTQTAAELVRLIGSPRLKVLYDIYHMQLNEGRLCDTIRQYADTFGHVHAADAPGRREPGTGEIAFPRVYKALEAAGYTGLVGYELFPARSTREAVKAILDAG